MLILPDSSVLLRLSATALSMMLQSLFLLFFCGTRLMSLWLVISSSFPIFLCQSVGYVVAFHFHLSWDPVEVASHALLFPFFYLLWGVDNQLFTRCGAVFVILLTVD